MYEKDHEQVEKKIYNWNKDHSRHMWSNANDWNYWKIYCYKRHKPMAVTARHGQWKRRQSDRKKQESKEVKGGEENNRELKWIRATERTVQTD